MLPNDLKPDKFSGYPPEARKIVIQHLAVLQQLPLSFLPGLLRELINFDFKFPAERKARDRELGYLSSLSGAQLKEHFGKKVYETVIPRNVRLAEAPSFGAPAVNLDRECKGSQAYVALAGEILSRNGIAAAV